MSRVYDATYCDITLLDVQLRVHRGTKGDTTTRERIACFYDAFKAYIGRLFDRKFSSRDLNL